MASDNNTITVIGAGYVGLSTAALLSNCGYKVYLVDVNKDRLSTIAKGKSFFYEEGINPLIKNAIDDGSLIPTDSYSNSIPKSHVVFSCVGTPDNPDGSSNLTYVFSAAKEAAKYMDKGSVYVQKSTVPVGTGKKIMNTFKELSLDVFYVSNPEFLREGTAISDTLWFDRIVCGGIDEKAIETVFDIYKTLESKQKELANIAGIKSDSDSSLVGNYFKTTLPSAELIKVTSNAFLALKISFANSIAKLSDKVGADINEVMDAVGQDRRIGRAFLNAGRGYGGGCFPKDMSGLVDAIREHGADARILSAAQDINASMPGYIVGKLQKRLGELRGIKIAVLGLAFKAGTSDARRSPGVELANLIHKAGASVSVYDPEAIEEARHDLDEEIECQNSAQAAIEGARVVLVATDWEELLNLDLISLRDSMSNEPCFVDCMNRFSISEVKKSGFDYMGVGRD